MVDEFRSWDDIDTLDDLQSKWYESNKPLPRENKSGLVKCSHSECEEPGTHLVDRLDFYLNMELWFLGLHFNGPLEIWTRIAVCRKHFIGGYGIHT